MADHGSTLRDEVSAHWRAQQRLLGGILAAAVPDERPVLLLDYPVYRNVGDLLIYLGTWAWLGSRAGPMLGAWSKENFCRRDLPGEAVLLLQGGGNFGDLYPDHQRFRERIVADYPDNRIVILPQSIHFADDAEMARSAGLLNRHRDLHLIVRDHPSQRTAEQSFSGAAIDLAPDMASFLHPLSSPAGDGGAAPLHLLRRDAERRSGHGDAGVDWPEILGALGLPMRGFQLVNSALSPVLPAQAF